MLKKTLEVVVGAAVLFALVMSTHAYAVPIAPTAAGYIGQWIGVAGKSRTLASEVDFIVVYATVAPSPNTPVPGVTTTVSATNAGFVSPLALNFSGPGSGSGGFPNSYVGFTGTAALTDVSKQGPWTVKATTTDATGSTSGSFQTNSLDPTARIDTAKGVNISGNGLSPTIAWDVPSNPNVTNARLDLLRITNEDPFQVELVYAQNVGSATEAIIPPVFGAAAINPAETALIDGAKYQVVLTFQAIDGNVLEAESYASFEFRAQADDFGGNVYLPTVTTDIAGHPIYNYDIAVQYGETIFVDPDVAVGYDFATGANDPGFASVLLPAVGDGVFDLYLFDGIGDAFDTGFDLLAGEAFSFISTDFINEMLNFGLSIDPLAGIRRFSVRGIETSALLDPSDAQAFKTGLTFVADGRFTGTQTPIIESVEVPEPGALVLMSSGVLMLGLFAMARTRRGART